MQIDLMLPTTRKFPFSNPDWIFEPKWGREHREEGQGDRNQGFAMAAEAAARRTFKELGERLEALKERHERGLLTSVEFLKDLLNLARDFVAAERVTPPLQREEEGKAALTQFFKDVRTPDTPIIVERVVNDIDEIVRIVRFDGWQSTHAGEREVKMALRKLSSSTSYTRITSFLTRRMDIYANTTNVDI